MTQPESGPKPWPLLFRLGPRPVVATVGMFLALVWLAIVVVDVVLPQGEVIVWMHLFNDRPVEWAQWLLLPAAAVSAGYLAARLPEGSPSRFFMLFAIGLSLMLVEDAGDVRHVVSDALVAVLGGQTYGLRTRTLSDVVYLGGLAAVPMYALLRYGRSVWAVRAVRPYMAGGYLLYALAATGSALSGLGLYTAIGRAMDRLLFAGRLSLPDWAEPEWSYFFVADSPLEETTETLAAALLLGMVLAYAQAVAGAGRSPAASPVSSEVSVPRPGS